MPKPNMYQSLHTTLMSRQEGLLKSRSERGRCTGWRKWESRLTGGTSRGGAPAILIINLRGWAAPGMAEEMKDANEFMETLKIDLFTDEVFVFTPKGDVVNLPMGSNPIDFAYAIHSAIGNKMVGAKVNGRIVPLGYELKNGDIVEILTSSSSRGPSRDWLGIVKSSQARSKINQWFKREGKQENIERGKEIVERELKKQGLEYSQLFREEWVDAALKRYNFSKLDDAYAAIGFGSISANKIISRLKEEYRKAEGDKALTRFVKKMLSKNGAHKEHVPERGIIVKGIDNCLVRLSRCCNPVPGDSIVGYITRGRGVSVHRKDCPNVRTLEQEIGRLIDVNWYSAGNVAYTANITVLANDRTALLMEITNCIGEDRINLTAINARTNKDRVAVINLTIEITDTEQLERLIKELRMIPDVFEVTRTKS